MSKRQSERALKRVQQELRELAPGVQRKVSDGVYMRLDRSNRRRFLARVRIGGTLVGSRTYDTWEEAEQARQELAASEAAPSTGDPTPEQMRAWTIERYAEEMWWELHVKPDCDVLTQLDYRSGLDDLLPLVHGVKMGDLVSSPMLVARIRTAAKAAKTYADADGEPRFYPAAADKIIAILRRICTHAVGARVLPFNPLHGSPKFNKRRGAASDREAPGHRPIIKSEVRRPEDIALVGVGMRGNPLELARRRLLPWLIAIGMRPSDILAMCDRWWRDAYGPRDHLHIQAAVKDVAGHLIQGMPKTGPRDLTLFPVLGEWLEEIYQLKGGGELDALTFPNRNGGLADWGNWRQQVWYPSLARIHEDERHGTKWPFPPYDLRHVGVTVMLHAQDPHGGTYSRHRVAQQFGHTVATLDRVYAAIPDNLHGISAKTMDQIIRDADRAIWGPRPSSPDYQEIEYDLLEAAELTGLSNKALAARIQCGTLPGVKRRGKYYVTRFDLIWHGLIARGAST